MKSTLPYLPNEDAWRAYPVKEYCRPVPVLKNHPFDLQGLTLKPEKMVRIYQELPLGLLKIKTNLNSRI